jgi:glycine/D-amino acid oxidase-like deaminating enzyme
VNASPSHARPSRSLTRHRDLRTGTPYWQSRRTPVPRLVPLARDIETDVLIVGAGISGALLAEALARSHRVTVLDRRGIAKGSTAASTALVEYEIDTPLTLLARKIGAGDAARAWRRSALALHALRQRTELLGIRADLVPHDTLYLAGDVLGAGDLATEAGARRAIGLDTEYIARGRLKQDYGMARAAALLSHGDFSVDPKRLTTGYLREAIANGARLYKADVADVAASRGGIVATTAAGAAIAARYVVFATGYEVPKIVPRDGHRIISTFAIATRPQPRSLWPGKPMIWEASDPYLYVRTTPDGRVICGGEDEEFADEERRDAMLSRKSATIARKLGRLFPQLDTTPQYAWAGSFGTTATGLPLIGPVPRHPRVWAILGFGGNGITYSRIAADIVSAALAGRRDPDADLYAFR